jgi:dTDP-glucose 4,6-dehydratase
LFRYVLAHDSSVHVVTLDKLTYAGNLENLAPVCESPRHRFVHGDICDSETVSSILAGGIDAIVHFAAESHVDRSILSPDPFIETNVRGTATLLDAARKARLSRFLLVSTDEVYGDIDPPHEADESFPLRPSSPYAASKAAADLLALSYVRTFKLPVVVTRASNNYGPYQFPEKLIPLMISNAMEGLPLPVYGDGLQVRDWLYVDDHCRGILAVLQHGAEGQVYNIGGNRALTNREVITRILDIVGAPHALMTDRG